MASVTVMARPSDHARSHSAAPRSGRAAARCCSESRLADGGPGSRWWARAVSRGCQQAHSAAGVAGLEQHSGEHLEDGDRQRHRGPVGSTGGLGERILQEVGSVVEATPLSGDGPCHHVDEGERCAVGKAAAGTRQDGGSPSPCLLEPRLRAVEVTIEDVNHREPGVHKGELTIVHSNGHSAPLLEEGACRRAPLGQQEDLRLVFECGRQLARACQPPASGDRRGLVEVGEPEPPRPRASRPPFRGSTTPAAGCRCLRTPS